MTTPSQGDSGTRVGCPWRELRQGVFTLPESVFTFSWNRRSSSAGARTWTTPGLPTVPPATITVLVSR
jgi:hypothetical protein